MAGSPNQNAIAKACGVSRASVSFALNPALRGRLKPETAQLILDTAKKMGYQPDYYAQMMRKKRTGKIGFIMAVSILETSLARTQRATQAIHEAGFGVISSNMMWDYEDFNRALELMLQSRVEGILLTGMGIGYPKDILASVVEQDIPIVKLMANPFKGVPHVCTDNFQGMMDLTRHVLGGGRSKLTLIGPVAEDAENKERYYEYSERIRGFRAAAEEAGVSRSDAVVLARPHEDSVNDEFTPAYTLMREIIDSGKLPDAVLCVNDHWAIGAMRACMERGVRIPDDVAFTGFDNDTFGSFAYSPLTTVAQPSARIAEVGVEMLTKWISGTETPPRDTMKLLPCEVVVRESCR